MGGDGATNATAEAAPKKRTRKESVPPDGYVCRLCSVPGHWIQVCPTKKTGAKRRRSSDHVPVPGKDPSRDDIEEARELQRIPPPKCYCGLPSRLNKVKRSREGGDDSRAIGKYFFFCSKRRDDGTQCRFARPAETVPNKGKGRGGGGDAARKDGVAGKNVDGGRDGNEKTDKRRPKQTVCKFFAKSGKCKKGERCEFSHDVPEKKAPDGANVNEYSKDEQGGDHRGSGDSSRQLPARERDHSAGVAEEDKEPGGPGTGVHNRRRQGQEGGWRVHQVRAHNRSGSGSGSRSDDSSSNDTSSSSSNSTSTSSSGSGSDDSNSDDASSSSSSSDDLKV